VIFLIVGIPKEIKNNENRVAITSIGVKELVKNGHTVLVERKAGINSGITDEEFRDAGAKIVKAEDVYSRSELVMKVKEPLPKEYSLIKPDQILFTYFHFASNKKLTDAMLKSGSVCIAYETVEDKDGNLPLLEPMSEVAGKMATQVAAYYLQRPLGGAGILLSGATGIEPANFVVIGGGTVGRNAARLATDMGAKVVILQRKGGTFEYLEKILKNDHPEHFDFSLIESTPDNLREHLKKADVVVGAVLVEGYKAPKIVTREMIKGMKSGSVIVDVAIDQGGIFETSRATTHSNPVYTEEGVLHYCVANMPGAFPRTSTFALTNATLPYALKLANEGLNVLKKDEGFLKGLNLFKGKVTNKGVAEAFDMEYIDPHDLL
jgi:alanine dehydrogenase